ncbi:MAG: LptA/OstA family protein [Verrucomicrobiales bacterium]
MKHLIALFALAATVASPPPASAQESSTDEVESKAQSLLGDPRLQNMLRSVKENPEDVAASVKQDPEEMVREATRLYKENKGGLDLEKADTPENRAKAGSAASEAMSTLGKMLPTPPPSDSDVPATRPPPASIQATPVAVPVRQEEPEAVREPVREMVVQETTVEPRPNSRPTEPEVPVMAASDVPEPRPLEPKYDTKAAAKAGKKAKDGKKQMEITSRESTMDSPNNVLTFSGNVLLNHPDFEIKCDKLEIHMDEGGGGMPSGTSGGGFKRAIASGGMVEMKRITPGPDGKTQIAMARRADYKREEGLIVLSGGPPYIQDGDSFVETTAADAQIIMRLNSQKYEIVGDRSRIVIPVEGKDGTGSIGLGDELGGGLGGRR